MIAVGSLSSQEPPESEQGTVDLADAFLHTIQAKPICITGKSRRNQTPPRKEYETERDQSSVGGPYRSKGHSGN